MNYDNRIFIINCFKTLKENHPEKFKIKEEYLKTIPKNMIAEGKDNEWKLVETNITTEEINVLENRFNVKLPETYVEFIKLYYHIFDTLEGTLDNYNFEEDVVVTIDFFDIPSDKSLKALEHMWGEFEELIELGYIPFADFEDIGPLCIDTIDNNKIVWLDHEEYYNCKTREEMKFIEMRLFNNFKEVLNCFFCGIKHDCNS